MTHLNLDALPILVFKILKVNERIEKQARALFDLIFTHTQKGGKPPDWERIIAT